MSSTAGHGRGPIDRLRQQTEIRALDEARKVPWRILANAAEEYTEWQIFALWLRAVLDAGEALPAGAVIEIENRSRALLSRIDFDPRITAHALGARAWEEVTQWTEVEVFAEAVRGEWLNAIRYFSSKSLLYIKAWSYWEEVHRQWRTNKPQHLPDYARWTNSVSAVRRLSNPAGEIQKVLDSVRSIPQPKWQQAFDAFMELTTVCLWIEILLGAGRTGADLVLRELAIRYPRFDAFSLKNSTISAVTDWAIEHDELLAGAQQAMPALSYHLKSHPAYYARRNYAAHCRSLFVSGRFDRLPSFTEWRNSADEYFER
jgi:hypothetical protein